MMNNNSLAFSAFFTLLLLCFTLPSLLSAKTIRCNPNDKKVLLQIKAAFGNPYHLASWDPNNKLEPDCCDWYALKCDINPPYRVTQLNIFQANISGQIPAAIGDLPYLQTIFFHHITDLTGTIPSSIAKLTNLNELIISNTHVSGLIPNSVRNLKKLEYVDLSRNSLTFDLSKVQFPPSVTSLDLNHNKIFGYIPQQLTQLKITHLNVSYNRLCGKIPQGGKLQDFNAYNYFHNQCLCGAPLPRCKTQLTDQIAN